jgi:epoxyqueuosine reductase
MVAKDCEREKIKFSDQKVERVKKIVRSHLIPSADYIYGFADLTGLTGRKFKGYNYGISIGKKLKDRIIDQIITGPTMEYFLYYKRINEELACLSQRITRELIANNIDAVEIEPTVTTQALDTIYVKTLRTDLSHKMVATRSGMGWIGKTDLFISKKIGPRLRLVSILLKTKVNPESKPVERSLCGSCNICVEICPAKAANGKLWDVNIEREDFFDPWKCRDQCAAFGKEKLGLNARICGMCVAACPIGQKKANNLIT